MAENLSKIAEILEAYPGVFIAKTPSGDLVVMKYEDYVELKDQEIRGTRLTDDETLAKINAELSTLKNDENIVEIPKEDSFEEDKSESKETYYIEPLDENHKI